MIIVSGLLKGHFDNRGHFFEVLYDEGPFIRDIFAEDIFTEGHFLKDQNSGTFRQGHFLKDICDGYLSYYGEDIGLFQYLWILIEK